MDPHAEERERVARTIAGISAAVRQRQGELAATSGGESDDLAFRLAELKRREFVQEPAPVSPRPVVGRLLVLFRKAAYHLFFKWHARAVLQQQNEFNQTAARLLEDLAAAERARRGDLRRLGERIEALEAREKSRPA